MTYKDLEAFEAEREAARKLLRQLGGAIAGPSDRDSGRIRHDFDVAYSTLPKLRPVKRIKTPALER